nr:uncharacterized mitochondrial protein AtMg00810-like [Tanacetum cinerariifolium]
MVTRPRLAHLPVTKSKSPIRRHITHSPSPKTSNSPPKVTVVKASVVSTAQELRRKLELAQKQKDEIQLTVENFENSSKNLSKLIDCQIVDKCKIEEFVDEPIVSEPTVKKTAVETSVAKTVLVDTARQVSTAHLQLTVNAARQMSYLSKSTHLSVKRPFDKKTIFTNSIVTQKVNTVRSKTVNTVGPKAVVNAVFENKVNDVKASACWFWKPKTKVIDHVSKDNSASITLKKIDYVDAQGRSKSVMAWIVKKLMDDMLPLEVTPKEGKSQAEEENVNNTNNVNAASTNGVNVVGANTKNELPFDPDMSTLEDISTFNFSSDQEDDDEEAEMNNTDTTIVLLLQQEFIKIILLIKIENLVDHKVKVIRCDNGTEFKNREINQFCEIKVNTACYVQSRVLVVKPPNKTPYELFHGRTPTLSFMRPFGCLDIILNTKDHLGKFNGKADKGFFVGYSLNRKAFGVFNNRTRIVEENLHIRFSEYTLNIVSSGPDWLFDIDALTRTMNYVPIIVGTQSNGFAGTKNNTGQPRKETKPVKYYILLLLWTANLPFSQDPKSSHNDRFKALSDDRKKVDENPSKGSKCNDQEKEDNVNSTNNVNDVSSTVNVVGTNRVNVVGENIMADMSNLDTTIQVSPTPTTRIYKDHPFNQVIEDLQSATQTKNMTKNLEEHGFVSTIQQRTNHKDLQNCLFACFLSQEEPKKIEEEVYVCKPPGFENPDFPDRVYKVKKALYGLHQAPRAWYETLSTYLLDNGFQREKIDKTLFIKRHKEVKNASTPMETQKPLLKDEDGEEVDVHMYRIYMYLKDHPKLGLWCPEDSSFDLVAYTDSDYAGASLDRKPTTGGCQYSGSRLISCQCKKWTVVANSKIEVEYVAALSITYYCQLKVNVARTINGEAQIHAWLEGKEIIITESSGFPSFSSVKNASTPIETQMPLLKDEDGEEIDVHMYRLMIGSLMYLTSSWPNIMFAVCACTRYQVNPKVSHLYAVKRIFRYLKGQPKFGLWYPKESPFDLVVYTDSDYAGASLDRKSTTGGSAYLNDPHHTPIIIQPSTSQPQKTKKHRKPRRNVTEVPQPSDPISVADEAINEEMDDSLERAVTTATSLDAEVESSKDEVLGEKDASKQGRIVDIDANEDIYLVNVYKDKDMFGVNDLDGDEVIVKRVDIVEQAKEVVDDITLAKYLMEIKSAKPKALKVVIQEPKQGTTTTTLITITAASSRPKAKGFVIHEQEKAPTPIDDVQAKIDVDYELAQRLQADEQEELTDAEKRVGDELELERSKKQKVEDDKESKELKKCLEIIPDYGDDVTIDATPLSFKSPIIVDYKIYHEGKKSYLNFFSANVRNYLCDPLALPSQI